MELTTKVTKLPVKGNTDQAAAADRFLGELEAEVAPPVETESRKNKKPYSTYFRPALLEEIKKAAEEDDVSVNTWINNACREKLARRGAGE